jgi:hypothetical protein
VSNEYGILGQTTDLYSLVNAGRAGSEQPKRLYQYALIDPVDAPHVIFRYHYRTWEQMDHLGLFMDTDSDSTLSPLIIESGYDKSVAELQERTATRVELRGGEQDDIFVDVSLSDDDQAKGKCDDSPAKPTSSTDTFESAESKLSGGGGDSKPEKRQYRLSIPPSLKLTPPEGRGPLPAIPQKQDSRQAHSYTAHSAYPVDEWEARTPSPVRSIRDGICTPPLGRRSGLTAASLIDVVTSAWKRRGTPTSEHSNDTGSRSGSRSREASGD